MSKSIVLEIGAGNLVEGFSIGLRLPGDGKIPGWLPPAPDLDNQYQDWLEVYCQQQQWWLRGIKVKSQKTNVSIVELSDELAKGLNDWLNSGDVKFRNVRDKIIEVLADNNVEQLIVESDCELLQRLPWHRWDILEKSQVEVCFSYSQYEKNQTASWRSDNQVKILAILGDSQGIDIEKDREMLAKLPGAEVKFLVEPQRQDINKSLWEQDWDILFFAGHSSSIWNKGRIFINSNSKNNSLTIEELKYGLKTAIKNGLKLAIFNSCDGLKLARDLAELNMPHAIVMRQPVPDKVAQEFLKHFLEAFSGGKAFPLAVREAREKLQGLENKFPCATWLPVICQNPAEIPPTWDELRSPAPSLPAPLLPRSPDPLLPSWWQGLRSLSLTSFAITGAVMGIRFFGLLQPLELWAIDVLMRSRPREGADPRILVVANDSPSIDYQDKLGMTRTGSLSDEALAKILDELEKLQPRIIGLNIYREGALPPPLAARLQNDSRFFAVCKTPSPVNDEDPDGVRPPSDIAKERLGFIDVAQDKNGMVRRHLLAMKNQAIAHPCQTEFSLSYRIASHYLKELKGLKVKETPRGEWQLGNVLLKKLTAHSSGYQGKHHLGGYQTLLNYRAYDSVADIAQEISVKEILENGITADLKNRFPDAIVLIGTTKPSWSVLWETPFDRDIPGVFLQAQMISEIISAVLDDRPLIWWWPLWIEALWIWGWSLAGGVLILCFEEPLKRLAIAVLLLGGLFGVCSVIFTSSAGWVPLVPPALAFTCTIAIVKPVGRASRLSANP